MRMTGWLITLPLLCVAGVAMAQGTEPGAAAAPAPAVAAPGNAQAPDKGQAQAQEPAPRQAKRRQGADMRRCLSQKSNKAIIRCAEPGRKP